MHSIKIPSTLKSYRMDCQKSSNNVRTNIFLRREHIYTLNKNHLVS